MGSRFHLEKVLKDLSGDHSMAMEQLFNHFYPRLYNFSKAFLKLEEGIDDILQEVFVKIWNNRKNIINPSTFNSYIFTITRNLLLNELRSRLNDQKFKEKLFERSVAEEYRLSEQIDYSEMKLQIDLAIDELPVKQKEVFLLSRMEGFSHKEISEKLDISVKTVEYHIHQSISLLKEKLKGLGLIPVLYISLFL